MPRSTVPLYACPAVLRLGCITSLCIQRVHGSACRRPSQGGVAERACISPRCNHVGECQESQVEQAHEELGSEQWRVWRFVPVKPPLTKRLCDLRLWAAPELPNSVPEDDMAGSRVTALTATGASTALVRRTSYASCAGHSLAPVPAPPIPRVSQVNTPCCCHRLRAGRAPSCPL